jgi:hypothetical protein
MQDPDQSEYFDRRAEEERTAAEQAADARAAQSHRELAQRYERRAKGQADGAEDGETADSGILSKDFRIIP